MLIEGHGRAHRDRAVEVTDVDDYLVSNPQFAECREEGHDFPRSRDVPLIEAYGDEAASHHKVLVCRGCKTKKRERFLITLRRGKVASFVQLETRGDYSEAVGYLARGIRINRAIREGIRDTPGTGDPLQLGDEDLSTPPGPGVEATAHRERSTKGGRGVSGMLGEGLIWTVWREVALSALAAFAKPKNLRLILNDGTVVPCTCEFARLDECGLSIWTVAVDQEEAMPAGRVRSVEVDEVPPLCGGIDLPETLMPSTPPA